MWQGRSGGLWMGRAPCCWAGGQSHVGVSTRALGTAACLPEAWVSHPLSWKHWFLTQLPRGLRGLAGGGGDVGWEGGGRGSSDPSRTFLLRWDQGATLGVRTS